MGATALSTLDGLLKRHYSAGFVANQQNFDPDFISVLPQATEKLGGEGASFFFPVNLQRAQNGGAQNENETFRDNASAVRKQATVAAKINIWAVEITGFAMNMSDSQADAFASGLESEFEDKLAAFKKDLNRQSFGTGSGKLALVNGALTASTALVVDTPGVQYFFPGMKIDIFNSAGTVKQASAVTVSSINESTNTITLASTVTCDDNGIIVKDKVKDNAASDGKEIMGLYGISDDGTEFTTFQNLSRSTYDIWKGSITDASGAVITNDLLQRAIDKGERRSGRKIDTIFSHRNQRRQYLNLVTPAKRFQGDAKMDSGMPGGLEWNGMIWNVSHDCQRDTIYAFPKKDVQKFESHPIKLDDTEGKTLHRISRTDTFEAYYKHYGNIGTKYPASIVRLGNLATVTD